MSEKNNHTTIAIIPCYNEAATIGSMVIQTQHYVDCVLVIDDGSTDDTIKIAKKAGATVLAHKKNKGKSSAIKTGFQYALEHNYDYIITIDGDYQHNPEEIPLLLDNLINNSKDISLGFRYGHTTEMPGWRKIGKRVLDYTTHIGSGELTDSQCGYRAFNKKAVKKLLPHLRTQNGFSTESEQLIHAKDLGLSTINTNISCRYNNLEKTSTKNPTSHGVGVLAYLIKLIIVRRPLLFIALPGAITCLIGLFLTIRTFQMYNQTNTFSIPMAMFTGITVFIGVIATFMGLMFNSIPTFIRLSRDSEEDL